MRRGTWLAGLALGIACASGAWAQQIPDTSLTNFGTGGTPPSHILQPPNPPTNVASPTSPVVPRPPSSPFNFLGFLKKIKFPSFSLFASANGPAPVLPGQHPDAYGPLLPTTVLPTPPPNAFNPLLPTTTLPTPPPNAYNPVLPPGTLPPPGQPDALHPLLPIFQNR